MSSSGGHLELLTALAGRLGDEFELVWHTSRSKRAEALAEAGHRVHWLPAWDKRDFKVRYLFQGARAALRIRPRLILTTGAGMALPFCLMGRLLGAHIVFVETMARVDSASSSGFILSRIAKRTLVQWPEMLTVYPRSTVCRPLLLEGVGDQTRQAGTGTFAAVGTHSAPFDRLLRAVDTAVGEGLLPAPVQVQSGVSQYRPEHFQAEPWLTPERLEAAVVACEYIVCHTGSGLLGLALRSGRRPIVMPRRREFAEHVDDHQVDVARKLEQLGLVVTVGDRLEQGQLDRALEPLQPPPEIDDLPGLREETLAALFATVH